MSAHEGKSGHALQFGELLLLITVGHHPVSLLNRASFDFPGARYALRDDRVEQRLAPVPAADVAGADEANAGPSYIQLTP
jgi:hypothetical protein